MSELLEQPCNKSDIFVKLVTSCQQVWNNLLTTLEQAVRTHLVDGLSADLLQVVRFLRVYTPSSCDHMHFTCEHVHFTCDISLLGKFAVHMPICQLVILAIQGVPKNPKNY